ncbi:hypothetical protein CHUAL_003228, partial [Chamberlinius hualienensis]
AAETIWNYMLMNHKLEKSQLILVLGNNDIRVAKHAAKLWLDGYGQYIMFTGYLGNLTKGKWRRPEYEVFREVAIEMGVSAKRIIVETQATNTGQNIRYSYEVLKNMGALPITSVILVQTPYMERRTYATFMKQWPTIDSISIKVQVTSPYIPLREYNNKEVGGTADIISIMLGCMQRILVYPDQGYQIAQDVPADILQAYRMLTKNEKFNNFLVNS